MDTLLQVYQTVNYFLHLFSQKSIDIRIKLNYRHLYQNKKRNPVRNPAWPGGVLAQI